MLPRIGPAAELVVLRTIHRIELPGGASLDVPAETLTSPVTREELIRALEVTVKTLKGADEIQMNEAEGDTP